MSSVLIDTSFDFRTDAGGKDPDTHSDTLRRYHKILWSKGLPAGGEFELSESGRYLRHESKLGEFVLSSDAVMQTFLNWKSMRAITSQLEKVEADEFMRVSYTIGGMMVFPANRVNRKPTINGARGLTRSISDRFDLTLECIRRFYASETSPLEATLVRYTRFFELFGDIRGYVDFFLLQDLITDDCRSVKFFMPFESFDLPAVPRDIETYREYRRRSLDFIRARNLRIESASPNNS